MINRINQLDWKTISNTLNASGYVVIKNLLSDRQCYDSIRLFPDDQYFRKTVVMERHRFGKGAYKYYHYPLPEMLQSLRELMYSKLVPVANTWMQVLNITQHYPESHAEFLSRCRKMGQTKATPLILKYGEGGYNSLHQDLYGEIYFPIQLVLFLSDPETEYEGGEFVITEQIPRAQSRAIVLRPGKGDAVLFTTSFRPVKGTRGYYRANMRHGVSTVSRGERYTTGLIFHDATA